MIKVNSYTILAAQTIAHLSIIPMLMYGSLYHWLIALFVYFLNGCLGMTMVYHRLLSHKSWNPPKFIEYLFTLFATIGMTGPAISWVAVHREHHKHQDNEKDPHSPKFKGWFWSHFLSMFAKVNVRYVTDLLRNPFYVWQHKWYFEINFTYAAVLYLIDPFALIYAWLIPAMILWNGGSIIVSTSHRNGDANNDLLFAFTTWGEGYHKNHHLFPNNNRFGKWDLGGWLIEKLTRN
jgi:stearoyl-CoA desaturase (delta-9 desaturase)|tara:strand:+ start:638 stop:1342 length:705 start_codon:yes stop_codon:yes gene_type:complete